MFGTTANKSAFFGNTAAPGSAFGAPLGQTATTTTTTTTTGFGGGINASAGFGQQPAQAGRGFGQQPTAAGVVGFGQQPTTAAAPQLQDFGRQSALGRYLLELDNAYNALHPNCRFRAILYNMCVPGQASQAMERDRFIAAHAGGGCREEELLHAQESNPDPLRMYPTAVHFMQELCSRAQKQQEAVSAMSKHADVLMRRAAHFRELDEANAAQYRELMLEQVMLQRRWYALLTKVETLRQIGQPLDEEARLASAVSALTAQLTAPGVYKTALAELRPFLDAETATLAATLRDQRDGEAGSGLVSVKSTGALRRRTDPQLLKCWTAFMERIQQGIEALDDLVHRDTADMRAIRTRVESA